MNKKHVIEKVNNSFQDTMMSVLGIEITDFGESYVSGKMPVDNRTKQPFGLLHGGASAAFAETLGSIGAAKHVDLEEYSVVGVELNKKHVIEKVNNSFQDTMMSVLGIEITDFGESYVSGKMPVDNRTKQPFGLLHGGASAAFAETLGSIGAGKHVDLEEYSVVGVELNSSHLKAVRTGWVFGKATPIRVGRTMQVWDIDIKNQEDDLICKSRLTLAVIKKNDR